MLLWNQILILVQMLGRWMRTRATLGPMDATPMQHAALGREIASLVNVLLASMGTARRAMVRLWWEMDDLLSVPFRFWLQPSWQSRTQSKPFVVIVCEGLLNGVGCCASNSIEITTQFHRSSPNYSSPYQHILFFSPWCLSSIPLNAAKLFAMVDPCSMFPGLSVLLAQWCRFLQ